ncbi:hypothetical protein [Rhizobium leguminosarum]|jgi:hypothetical protein|nr:hypothetical protein [Rhizobium leguminosarum]
MIDDDHETEERFHRELAEKSGRSLPRKLKHAATLPAQRVLCNI